jgi:hypothetical protein
MNHINNPYQTDTKRGEITLPANLGANLLENLLMVIYNNGGVASFRLPTALGTLYAIYIMSQYNAVALTASGEVPSTNENCRLKAYGTGNAGDALILADPTANAGAQAGMVRSAVGNHAPAGAAGAIFCFGIAEEAFVDGQDVKARFLPSIITF